VTPLQILAFIWAGSAVLSCEAYAELYGKQCSDKLVAIAVGSLTPILNTLIAACYVRDKLKRRF
jgi:hypothetical protein